MSEIELTDKNFEEEVVKHDGVILVDFWAPWCGPCQMMGPIIEEAAKELDGKAKVGKLNVDENTETATKFSVQSIPTLVIFKNGEVQEQITGVTEKEELVKKVLEHVKG